MKIIKEGKKRVTTRRLTCHRCGCIFEYRREDMRETHLDLKPWVRCPYCNIAIDVDYWEDYG